MPGIAQTQQLGHFPPSPATAYELKSDFAGLMTFPERLNMLLQEGELKGVMWWLPDGDAFCLVPANFERVLNQHFHGTKFESFTRKLNRWGFKRMAGQNVPLNTIAYYHRSFHRDKPELIKYMRVGSNTKTKGRSLEEAVPPNSPHRPVKSFARHEQSQNEGAVPEVIVQSGGVKDATFVGESSIQQARAGRNMQQADQSAATRRIMSATQKNDAADQEGRMRMMTQGGREGGGLPSAFSSNGAVRTLTALSQSLNTRGFVGSPIVPSVSFPLDASQGHHLPSPNDFGPSNVATLLLAQQLQSSGFLGDMTNRMPTQYFGVNPGDQMSGSADFTNLILGLQQGANVNASSDLMPVLLAQRVATAQVNNAGTNTGNVVARMLTASHGDPQLFAFYMFEHQRRLGRQNQQGNPFFGL